MARVIAQTHTLDDQGGGLWSGGTSIDTEVDPPVDPPTGDWQLPTGHFIPAKMTPVAVYPRPDSETQAHARHRHAHPDFEYVIPIGVQGGAWPFKYEIVSGPTGATIGEVYGSADYGVIKWTPQTSSGVESFNINVPDQDLTVIYLTWSTTIATSQFVFIQDGWAGTKTGTIDEPLEDYADYYKGDDSDSTYANKIIVFRGGNYSLYGDAASSGNAEMNTGVKTPSYIGYPNETPIIDCSQAKILTRNGTNVNDLFVAGIRWENSRQDVDDAHFFWVIGTAHRLTFHDNYFYNHGTGLVGDDNTAAVFAGNSGETKEYYLYKHNVHDTFSMDTSLNASYIDFYLTKYAVVEENTAKNTTGGYGFWLKSTDSFVTVRANDAYDNVTGLQITLGYGSIGNQHSHEVCWNRVVLPTGDSSQELLLAVLSTSSQGVHYNTSIYRNTFVNGSSWVRFPGVENYQTDGNIIVSNLLSRWDTSIMDTLIDNVTGGESDGITDLTGVLVGAYRAAHLGVAGHEVS